MASVANGQRVLVAGHMPNLAGLVSLLLACGSQDSIQFQRGGCCRLDLASPVPGLARLVWHLPPEILGRLAG